MRRGNDMRRLSKKQREIAERNLERAFREGKLLAKRSRGRKPRRRRRVAKALKRNRRRWTPPAPFTVIAEYKGYDHDRDDEIRVAARKKHSDGSGYWFTNNVRDLSFGFDRRSAAIAAAKRITKLRGVKARVEGRVWP